MQSSEQKPLSFIDVLSRNLFLFTVMCICVGFGVVITFLEIDSLDSYIFQIQSSRLNFVFFIGMAACYVSLLFISLSRYWLNFIIQGIVSIVLFLLLLFIVSPPLKIKSYLFDHYIEFSTRPWQFASELPVGERYTFDSTDLPMGHSYYFFSFVFTSYATSPLDSFVKTNEE